MQQLSFSQYALVVVMIAGVILLTIIYTSIAYLLVSKLTNTIAERMKPIRRYAIHPKRMGRFLGKS